MQRDAHSDPSGTESTRYSSSRLRGHFVCRAPASAGHVEAVREDALSIFVVVYRVTTEHVLLRIKVACAVWWKWGPQRKCLLAFTRELGMEKNKFSSSDSLVMRGPPCACLCVFIALQTYLLVWHNVQRARELS